MAIVDPHLYAAGAFTSAGGDPQAQSVASFALMQIIAYPTPTVTPSPNPNLIPTPTGTPSPNPDPVLTPTVTPSPTPAAAPDATPPATSLCGARINHAKRKATFRFTFGEAGSTFSCKLDERIVGRWTSPRTYNQLKPGKRVYRVKARDRAGNLDTTPAVKRFKIKKR